jgi:hypothetical protein
VIPETKSEAAVNTAFFLKSEHDENIGSRVTIAITAAVLRTNDLSILSYFLIL